MKNFYAENQLTFTAQAILDSAKILEHIEKEGIVATPELRKSVQSSIKELCTLMLRSVE